MSTTQGIGKVVEWNDARGYGFIETVDDRLRVFFHIRDYSTSGRRPETGEVVHVSAVRQPDGRWRADKVRRAAHRRPGATRRAMTGGDRSLPLAVAAGAIAAYGCLVAWSILQRQLPMSIAMAIPVFSLVTWTAYWWDKRAAGSGGGRTPESMLHLLEFLGGWPGALLAQRLLRHKCSKPGYLTVFWLLVALHVMLLLAWPELIR